MSKKIEWSYTKPVEPKLDGFVSSDGAHWKWYNNEISRDTGIYYVTLTFDEILQIAEKIKELRNEVQD